MRSLFLAAVPLALLAVASMALISGCGRLYADKVVSVGERELTVAKGPEETPETHAVAADAKVTLDGKPAELEDIRPGDTVKVTTEEKGDEEIAVKIEAKRPQDEDAAAKTDGSDELTPSEAEPVPHDERPPALPEDNQRVEVLFTGAIAFVNEHRIRVHGDAQSAHLADEMVFEVVADTEITVAGEPATLKDLAEGMAATVTAERVGDEVVARRIDVKPMPL